MTKLETLNYRKWKQKKYNVEYLINVDNETFINSEVVIAYNKKEAFVKAVNQGEQRFLSKGYKCIISQI